MPFPIVNSVLYHNIEKVVSVQANTGAPPSAETMALKAPLIEFFNNHYVIFMEPEDADLSSSNIDTSLIFSATDYVTDFNNNIIKNYSSYVKKYIEVFLIISRTRDIDENPNLNNDEKKAELASLYRQKEIIYNDIIAVGGNPVFRSNIRFHEWINFIRNERSIYDCDSHNNILVSVDIENHPQDYFRYMFYIMRSIEEENLRNTNNGNWKQVKLNNLFPLRTSFIPKFFCLDTTCLILNLFDPNVHGSRTTARTHGNLHGQQDSHWGKIFDFKNEAFKILNEEKVYDPEGPSNENWTFKFLAKCNGNSTHFCYTRCDLRDAKYGSKLPIYEEKKFQYIHTISPAVRAHLQGLNLIAGDPGDGQDLAVFTNSGDNGPDTKYVRFSRRERFVQTKQGVYQRTRQDLIRGTLIADADNNEFSVEEWIAVLSDYSHKTTRFDSFGEYIEQKLYVLEKISEFYRQNIFRKLQFNAYINSKKSNQLFMEKFREKFGPLDNSYLVMGDYSSKRKGYHPKHHQSGLGVGIIRLINKEVAAAFVEDEYKTSTMCPVCKIGKCKLFRTVSNGRPYQRKYRPYVLCWGLKRCDNINCGILYNRDHLGSTNIYIVANAHVNDHANNYQRPVFLRRGNNDENDDFDQEAYDIMLNNVFYQQGHFVDIDEIF